MTLRNFLIVILSIIVFWAVVGWVLATNGHGHNVQPSVHVQR